MASRLTVRTSCLATRSSYRTFTTSATRFADAQQPPPPQNDFAALNKRGNDTAQEYRKYMVNNPLTPHMTNTNSTIANEMPNLGADGPPPELITSVDPNYTPKDSVPKNTEKMTGGTQKPSPDRGPNVELKVGEIEGGSFRVEPLRRTGEDANTMRARLLYQSRKRGTLESDLLLSTFADANLASMSAKQLQQYDLFLDENDWDIYYWATQEPLPTSMETAEGGDPVHANAEQAGKAPDGGPVSQTDDWRGGAARSGEWSNTVGRFKPAYRPVPQRWKSSEILSKLRKHVIDRSAGGVHVAGGDGAKVDGKGRSQGVVGTGGGGLGMMPEIRNFDV